MLLNKLPVMDLVKFRHLSERSKSTFANNLKLPITPKAESSNGGNYWVRSLSGLNKAFKLNDNSFIQKKIDDVVVAYDSATKERTKTMHKRNLEILHDYINFDFSKWRPSEDLHFLPNHKLNISVNDILVEVLPSNVFSYTDNNDKKIGAIWFVAWFEGFKPGDLSIFSEAMFKYLSFIYSKDHIIDSNYCLIVDISNGETLSYQQLVGHKNQSLLESTVDMLIKFL